MSMTSSEDLEPRGELLPPSIRYYTCDDICRTFRERMVAGFYQPGSRLPSRVQVCKEFSSTPTTVQRVFDRLTEEGFVVPRGRAGTFVADHPPHLSHYGIVFAYPPTAEKEFWPRFWTVIEQEAERYARGDRDSRVHFSQFYYPIDTESVERFHELIDLVNTDRIAGLLFAAPPRPFVQSPILSRPGLPRIFISMTMKEPLGGVLHLEGILDRSLQYLHSRGRKRLAVLTSPASVDLDTITDRIHEHGLETRSHWLQAIMHDADPRWAHNLVELLLRGSMDEQPDCLIITDDNLVESVTQALVEFNVRVPDDLDVVAHANFPDPTHSLVPAARVGCNVRDLLCAAIDWIDAERRGGATTREITVPSVLEPMS